MARKPRHQRLVLESLEGRTLLSLAAGPEVSAEAQVAAQVAADPAPLAMRPTGFLKAAESLDSESVRLDFKLPIPRQFAPRLRFEVDGLQVTGVELSRNGRGAVLTTSPQSDAFYTARVSIVQGSGDRARVMRRATAPFQGQAAPRVVEVGSTGENSVLVTFDRPMGASAIDPANYLLSGDDGQVVGVGGARFVGGSSNQVELLTTPQAYGAYTLNITNVLDSAGQQVLFEGRKFNGDPRGAVVSVAATSSTTVVIAFNEPLADNALAPQHYEIRDPSGAPLLVTDARFDGPLGMVVVLTTEAQRGETYSLTASNITDLKSDGLRTRSGSFEGIAAPALVAAIPTQPTKIVLTFSGPVGDSALAPSTYQIDQLDDEGNPVAALPIEAARFVGGQRTVVELSTASQLGTSYRIATTSTLTDVAGTPLPPASAEFTGIGPLPESPEFAGPPRVVGAASLSNTEVLVSFSEPMADNATRPEHFVIAQEVVNPEAGALLVTAAEFYQGDRTVVKLSTRSQNELTYRVTVVNATDLVGNALAPKLTSNGVLLDPTSATFPGTPPSGDQLVDTDGDGLTDNEEQRGWLVTFRTADGRTVERMATSDILDADTDGDGFTDDVEAQLKTDPRDIDTDDDLLTDWQEYTEIFSDHLDADSDGDGVDDGTEFLYVRSSPNFEDTDGDQIPDGTEISLGGFYNVLLANLPAPKIEVGDVDLSLRLDIVATSSKGNRKLESKTAESTLTTTDNQSFSSTSESTQEAYANAGYTQSYNTGGDGSVFPENTHTITAEAGWSGSWRSEYSNSSSRETQRALANARSTEKEVQVGEELQTQLTEARIQTTINLSNSSPIAFRLKNLQVTALMIDPRNPLNLVPVATLVPDIEPEDGFAMGPLVPARGPIIVSSQNVFPGRVEALMANPQSLVFKISNFDILDEAGRNFAFASQEVVERTARIELDYGGLDANGDGRDDGTEILFVSTAAGRAIEDTDGDGTVDDSDRRVTFDPAGKQVGITVRTALADAGLAHYTVELDEDGELVLDPDFNPALRVPIYYDADGDPVKLSEAQIRNSYATVIVDAARPDGSRYPLERIFRIRERANTDLDFSTWEVITPTGIDPNKGIDDTIYAGENFTIAFVQDRDRDFVPASLEAFYGSRDTSRDTDGDGLDDRFEALIGWETNIPGRGIVRVTSSPRLADTDGDGRSDRAEAPARWVDADGDGLMDDGELTRSSAFYVTRSPLTGPTALNLLSASDTDGDGIYNPDFSFLPATDLGNGVARVSTTTPPVDYYLDENSDGALDLALPQAFSTQKPFIDYVTDPTDPDTDRDRIGDFDEVNGFSYRPIDSPTNRVVKTNPELADTDGDSVGDGLERQFGLDPSDGLDRDSDGDGLPNRVETTGWEVRVERVSSTPLEVVRGPVSTFTGVASNPNLVDTDGDGLTDFEEYFLRTLPSNVAVALPGAAVRGVDSDGDGISDFDEVRGFRLVGVDRDDALVTLSPLDADVDNDGLSDGEEAGLGLDADGKSIPLGFADRWVVTRAGEEPRRVFTDPREPDGDNDQLPDGAEKYRTEVRIFDGVKSVVYSAAEFNVQVMPWGDGTGVPTSGQSLIIFGVDDDDRLHIRIFDARGKLFIDADETELPSSAAPFIPNVRTRISAIQSAPIDQRKAFINEIKNVLLQNASDLVGGLPSDRVFRGSDPEASNTDGDRRPDFDEALLGTDPTVAGFKITVQFDFLQFNSGDADDGDIGNGPPFEVESSLLGGGDVDLNAYIRRYDVNSARLFNLGELEEFFDPKGDVSIWSGATQVKQGAIERFSSTSPRSTTFELANGQSFSLGALLREVDNIDTSSTDYVQVVLGDYSDGGGVNVKVDGGEARSAIFTAADIQALLDSRNTQIGIFSLVFEFTKADNTDPDNDKGNNDKMAGKLVFKLVVE
jgi:hypothetical protein